MGVETPRDHPHAHKGGEEGAGLVGALLWEGVESEEPHQVEECLREGEEGEQPEEDNDDGDEGAVGDPGVKRVDRVWAKPESLCVITE